MKVSDARARLAIEPRWKAPASVHAAFTLRTGGVSGGAYASLNLGVHVGDELARVETNRQLVRAALELPDDPVWLDQVHGCDVLAVDRARVQSVDRPVADASITRERGCVLAIQVADCLPVLFAARDASVIGAAHAGWRGLATGVLERTIDAMSIAPAELVAWLGPAIGPRNFEVGDDVRDAFLRDANDVAKPVILAAFERNSRGRWQCDLQALAKLRLAAAGVRTIDADRACTYAEPDRFFSYRRDGQCGRMAALIWLAEARE